MSDPLITNVAQRISVPHRPTGQQMWRVEDDPTDPRWQMLRWGEALIAEVHPHKSGGWKWIVWLGETYSGRLPETADPWQVVWKELERLPASLLEPVTAW